MIQALEALVQNDIEMPMPTTPLKYAGWGWIFFETKVKKLTTLVGAMVDAGFLSLFERIKGCEWILILKNEHVLSTFINLGV